MAWQNSKDEILSSAAICRVLTSHLTGPGLVKHHEDEALVLWAFHPGRERDGTERTLPPLAHDQFVAATRAWADAGTPCP